MRPRLLLPMVLVLGCARNVPLPRPTTSGAINAALRACRDGNPYGCYWKAVVAEKDPAAAHALFESSCTAGVAEACNMLGADYSEGRRATVKDPPRGLALWERSCALGSKDGCDSWGTGLRDGVGGPPQPAAAVAAYEKACALGDGPGCTNLASALLQGSGTLPNPDRALALLQQVCAREEEQWQSCGVLGRALLKGDVLPADRGEGIRLLVRGCNLGHRGDCFDASLALSARGDAAQALRYLRASCSWGEVKGCAALGAQLITPPLDANRREEALAVLRFACARSDADSCTRVAALQAQ